jgi:hypothetical protein
VRSVESGDRYYFLVFLTKQGKLLDCTTRAKSLTEALDKCIGALDLAGNIQDYKFCVKGIP